MSLIKTEQLREKLMQDGLNKDQLEAQPIKQFEHWYQETLNTDIAEPTAMSLATVDSDGQPWQRMVLLKLYDEKGFVFFTNYESRKAQHIAENNKVNLLFPWYPLGRQVKITGCAEKISTAQSLKYFSSRSRGSQIGAWSSHQSAVIKNRALLDGIVETMKNKFADGSIPLPDFWGGFLIKPTSFEFWQARESRLHDCFFYQREKTNGEWLIQRLAP